MARPIASFLALALAAVLALGAVSCGSEDAELLPGGTAREITANLDAVEELAAEGDCAGAESAAQQVSEQVEALEGIDPRLERALRDGAARLEAVVAECEEPTAEAVTPPTVPDGEAAEEEPEQRDRGGRRGAGQRSGDDGEGNGREGDDGGGGPALPPQANGKGEGRAPGGGEDDEAEEPSGGISPASPAGEGR